MKNNNWSDIWESRISEAQKMSHGELLAVNGYDNPRSTLTTRNLSVAQDFYWNIIKLNPHDSVYEVGCGSGAFLYRLYDERYKVGGLDLSSSLIELAKTNLPGGQFTQADAMDLDTTEKWDHVMSFSLFFYFPDMKYAEKVLMKMIEKANKTVSLYDLPNLQMKEDAERARREGIENYDVEYAGLKHLYFTKKWFCDFAQKKKLHLTIFDQKIDDYENGKYRFCVVLNKNL